MRNSPRPPPEPSRADPSRAEHEPNPSEPEPSRAEPGRAELRRADLSRAEPNRADSSRKVKNRAEMSRAGGHPCATFLKNNSFCNELCVLIPSSKTYFVTMNLITLLKELVSRLRRTPLLWRPDKIDSIKSQNILFLP